MGRRINVPKITMGRDTERIKGSEKVQIYAGGEGLAVYSFPRIVKHQSAISFLPCVFCLNNLFGLNLKQWRGDHMKWKPQPSF